MVINIRGSGLDRIWGNPSPERAEYPSTLDLLNVNNLRLPLGLLNVKC